MFGFFADAIENTFSVAGDLLEGEVDKRKVAKLIDDGMTVATVATVLGVGVDVVENILEEE